MKTVVTYRPLERPWWWATYIYGLLVWLWFLALAVRHVSASVWQFAALSLVFVSLALLGLYTGKLDMRGAYGTRSNRPPLFWFMFVGYLFIAAVLALPLLVKGP